MVKDIAPGPDGSHPEGLAVVGGQLLFAADDGTTGHEPWISDGTPHGTFRVADLHPGPDASSPEGFAALGSEVFFSADDGRHGRELHAFTLGAVHAPCAQDATVLCLQGGRFRVTAEWLDFAGVSGPARVVPAVSETSGLFWFFAEDNWEMMVKVLDGCAFNGRHWVFAAATTNAEYRLTVTDTATGEQVEYFNPLGRSSPAITDTDALGGCG